MGSLAQRKKSIKPLSESLIATEEELGKVWDRPQRYLAEADDVTGYVFKVWLNEIDPLIWQRFKVPANLSFSSLHEIVQIVMGWENFHLYRFAIDGFGFTENPMGHGDRYADELIDPHLQRLDLQFFYEYDFGDHWIHALTLEHHLSEAISVPLCMAGRGACPSEDCGGLWVYDQFLHSRKKRKGRVSPKWQDRIGNYWDADAFALKQVNHELSDYWQSRDLA